MADDSEAEAEAEGAAFGVMKASGGVVGAATGGCGNVGHPAGAGNGGGGGGGASNQIPRKG